MERVRRGMLVLLVGAMLVALHAAAGISPVRADEQPDEVAALVVPTPEAAIRAAVEAGGRVYAGDCADAVSPRDLGRICSRLVEEKAEARAYLVGRTFSEFSTWVFVAPVPPDGWRVAASVPLDFFGPPEPPWPQRL